ncbi:hypothetical protein ONE63_000913 [Megalurothrips usitatus]|uniref:Uncharacterized protein n=1 Tax=Megalurothrips usitatus TaxID=439358 RepID=A0AAV7Y5Y3_9NEOP|nr:hypothetical protein ONE63_000913 [Megalurothrips usitatus]
MSGLSRALSWPLISNGCLAPDHRLAAGSPLDDEDVPDGLDGRAATASPPPTPAVVVVKAATGAAQARRLLCRHYYPEGGWGWVVVFCCASVHLLVGGLQLSWAVLLAPTANKFDILPLHTGEPALLPQPRRTPPPRQPPPAP